MSIIFSAKSLVYVSLICSLITLLFSKNRFIRCIKFISGIVMLTTTITVLSPLVKHLGYLIDFDFNVSEEENADNVGDDLIINQSASYICEYVKTLIMQKYSIQSESLSVSVTLDTSDTQNVTVKNVTISFIKTDSSLYAEIARYVSDIVGCECTVISK